MTIPTYQADIDMPGNQIYIKFRNQGQPVLFVSAPKAQINGKNFALVSEMLRRNPRDVVAVNLADWVDGIAAS